MRKLAAFREGARKRQEKTDAMRTFAYVRFIRLHVVLLAIPRTNAKCDQTKRNNYASDTERTSEKDNDAGVRGHGRPRGEER